MQVLVASKVNSLAVSFPSRELSLKEIHEKIAGVTAEQIEHINAKLVDKLKTTVILRTSCDVKSMLEMAKDKFGTILSIKFSTPSSLSGVGICIVGDCFPDYGATCILPVITPSWFSGSIETRKWNCVSDYNTWLSRPFQWIDPDWLPPQYSLCLYLDVEQTQSISIPVFVIEEKSEGKVLTSVSFSLSDL